MKASGFPEALFMDSKRLLSVAILLVFYAPHAERCFFIRNNQLVFFDKLFQQESSNIKSVMDFRNISALIFEGGGGMFGQQLFRLV